MTMFEDFKFEPPACPQCNSSEKVVKNGTRSLKEDTVQLYLCRTCNKKFSDRKLIHTSYPPKVILSALTASNMAATAEIARQIGEENPFKLMFHEGDDQNIYLSNVAGSFLLVVLFSTKVQIGLVRLFTGQAVKNLIPLAAEFENVQKEQGRVVDDEFGQALTTEIESLFGEN